MLRRLTERGDKGHLWRKRQSRDQAKVCVTLSPVSFLYAIATGKQMLSKGLTAAMAPPHTE